MSRWGWRGGADVPGGAVDGGQGGPARDLGGAASQMCFPLRNSELLSMHTQHYVLVRCLARRGLLCLCPRCLPRAQGKSARGCTPRGQGELGPLPGSGAADVPISHRERRPGMSHPDCRLSPAMADALGTASLFLMPAFSPILGVT